MDPPPARIEAMRSSSSGRSALLVLVSKTSRLIASRRLFSTPLIAGNSPSKKEVPPFPSR